MPRLNIERLNAAEVIQESLNLFAEERREIKFVCIDQNIMINADHDQLRRTIINLIRNSLQAQSKKIAVTLKKVENLVYLSVTDDGKGIDPENINKVFDENFTTKKSGMGIGLSLARKFIEGIGGTISVVNSSGAGTEFLITLPLAE
jgi:signal transduction histidine kinase